MQPLAFKFKYVDEQGNEQGFLSKKGRFDGQTLSLGKDSIPVLAIRHTLRRFDRLILTVVTSDGASGRVALAITGGSSRKLLASLNVVCSRAWAEARGKRLEAEGRGAEHRTELCSHCGATLDLTGLASTAQTYCGYCDTIATTSGRGPRNESSYGRCDQCGLWGRPSELTVFYFYFLVVVYGWRYRKEYICRACMRGAAWKMLAANLVFVLGVPTAIIALIRAYSGSVSGDALAPLDRANALASKGRVDDAERIYRQIESAMSYAAGLHFNRAMSFARARRLEEAARCFEHSLADCSSYEPSFQGLRACYAELGESAKREALERSFGVDPSDDGS